jgi:hypothetical protein
MSERTNDGSIFETSSMLELSEHVTVECVSSSTKDFCAQRNPRRDESLLEFFDESEPSTGLSTRAILSTGPGSACTQIAQELAKVKTHATR